MESPQAFSTMVRERRAKLGLTQEELARRAGMSVRALRYLEQGYVRNPRTASIRQLIAALDAAGDVPVTPAALRIGVLGPLSVEAGGRPVDLGRTRHAVLLGLLALHPNRPVPLADIADMLWPHRPPRSHANLVNMYVRRLRKQLGPALRLVAVGHGGYQLEIEPAELDLLEFTELTALAGAAGDGPEACELYSRALACWRGPVLADLDPVHHHPTTGPLGRQRLSATLAYADIGIALGRHEQAATQLRQVRDEEPLHEGLHARLMIALAGSGQQATALELFDDLRGQLSAELGIEPGPELRSAQLQVLRQEIPGAPCDAGNSLPRDVDDFVGRATEIQQLSDSLGRTPVHAISGMAGVGKTALAVHFAHELAPGHTDGRLFVDLHAHTAGHAPLSARDALESLLRRVGVEGERIPERLDDCAALWRAVTADTRLLVVLDNAADSAQVRPLLPNGRQNRTLITSRRRLASLENVQHHDLDVLPPSDAAALFARAYGRPVDGRADAVAEVLRLCGFLPLAVWIAAAKARAHPSWTVAHLTDRLRDERRRLGELHVGDLSVDAAFGVSYRLLGEPQQRMFRLLGDSPAHDFDAYAAAALAGIPHGEAEALLDDLLDTHLLLEPAPGRFRFHDLLRNHARAAARHHETDEACLKALTRLAGYYLHSANRSADLLEPTRRRWDPGVPAADLPRLTAQPEAVAWLATEHHNLVATIAATFDRGLWNHCWQLAQCLWRYLFLRGHLHDWIATHQLALDAARRVGDTRTQAEIRKNLGLAHWRRADFATALSLHHEALALDERDADVWGQAKTHNHLGFIHTRLGHHAEAVHHQQLAVRQYREARDSAGEAWAQIGLGDAYFHAGDTETSRIRFARALDVARSIGHRPAEILALIGLGFARRETGRPHLEQALYLARDIGDRWSECLALTGIGICDHLTDATTPALDRLGQATAMARETGDRWALQQALTALGRVLSAIGRHAEAITAHEEALELARTLCNHRLETDVLRDLTTAKHRQPARRGPR